jgi:hypothetical protein
VSVRRNPAAVRRLLYDPSGPVGRDLTRRGIRITNKSRVLCPVDKGRLRASIRATPPFRGLLGLSLDVGTNVKYARAVHNGSGSPDAPFSWRVAQARGHPVRARRFLVNALPAGRR